MQGQGLDKALVGHRRAEEALKGWRVAAEVGLLEATRKVRFCQEAARYQWDLQTGRWRRVHLAARQSRQNSPCPSHWPFPAAMPSLLVVAHLAEAGVQGSPSVLPSHRPCRVLHQRRHPAPEGCLEVTLGKQVVAQQRPVTVTPLTLRLDALEWLVMAWQHLLQSQCVLARRRGVPQKTEQVRGVAVPRWPRPPARPLALLGHVVLPQFPGSGTPVVLGTRHGLVHHSELSAWQSRCTLRVMLAMSLVAVLQWQLALASSLKPLFQHLCSHQHWQAAHQLLLHGLCLAGNRRHREGGEHGAVRMALRFHALPDRDWT